MVKTKTPDIVEEGNVVVTNTRVHNLLDLSVEFPRNQLVVITGISGSGKSSLAFDTLYAEGQRRYLETFSAYARQFLGSLKRPDVDKIDGLSPVISIEQKTISRNPRSTVGTITEIYDYLRVLFSNIGEAYSYVTNEKMIKQTDEQIIRVMLNQHEGKKMYLLAPVVKGRKGHYRELFEQISQQGFVSVRVDGELHELKRGLQVDRYKVHDIEVVIDKIIIEEKSKRRLLDSVRVALQQGKGVMSALEIRADKHAGKNYFFSEHLMCPVSGIAYDEPAPNSFSFNSPYGACKQCHGIGFIRTLTVESLIPDPNKSIEDGAIEPLGEYKTSGIFFQLNDVFKKFKCSLSKKVNDLPPTLLQIVLHGTTSLKEEQIQAKDYPKKMMDYEGIIPFMQRHYESNVGKYREWMDRFSQRVTCTECSGGRLKKESLFFKIEGRNIFEVSSMSLDLLYDWIEHLPNVLTGKRKTIAFEILKEISKRVQFLKDVGLAYLSLNRPSKSLSGGEAQRIRLATQIGSQLVGVMYILDEPSIGLHQKDNNKLIKSLMTLRDIGNSVVVVEHDKQMILDADFIIEIGPGAGKHGGKLIAAEKPEFFLKRNSITASYLNGKKKINVPVSRRKGNGKHIRITGATGNNLKNVNVDFPLGLFICVTGVSGSGKSTLINETLYPILHKYFFKTNTQPLAYEKVDGLQNIDKIIDIDQSAIGRTPRSNPATYTGVFSEIRNLFVMLPEAVIRGYKPGRFSFNVKGGRCTDCEGGGMKVIEMNFMPDVYILCDTCKGKRYNTETLEIRYKGKSISDVLTMTVNEAVEFFEHQPGIYRKIKTLQDVGLGYITLGQSSTTLSGGEAQRVKLATELSRKDTGKTLFILDEPTTGLHFEDIRILMMVLERIVAHGNTVLVIEHNLDVIKTADHIIDIGPEGGEKGGEIICCGTPEEVAMHPSSFTGLYLKEELGIN